MSNPSITFYDIKTLVPGLPTSPNTWRVRLVLNYKNLPYETAWSEGPDIAETCIAAGIPPLETRADGSLRYTLPALVDLTRPDAPVRLTESRAIIDYLEATYPDPSPQRALFPSGTRAFQKVADAYVQQIIDPLAGPLIMLGMMQKQPERSRPAFEKYAPPGKTLQEASLQGAERTKAWARLRAAFDKLGESAEGEVFFAGNNLSYLDIHLLAGLIAIKLSVGDSEFEKELGNSAGERWIRLLNACAALVK